MNNKPRNHEYLMRVTIELYDSADSKARRYAAPAAHFRHTFTASDDNEACKIQAHCWHACGLAVFNELNGDKKQY